MFKTLIKGFVFGIGFTLAVIIIIWLISLSGLSFSTKTSSTFDEVSFEEKNKWRALPTSEKLSKSSGLALLRFKEVDKNEMQAYVDTILTKNDLITLPVKIGDRVEKSDFFPNSSSSRNRDGVLLLFKGNPAQEIEGTFLYDNRLLAYGDMPIKIFIRKFKEIQK